METVKFNAEELCSRKLWQLLNTETDKNINDIELSEVIAELAKRRYYLEKLQESGKLSQHSPD
jgi:hypothetical protein